MAVMMVDFSKGEEDTKNKTQFLLFAEITVGKPINNTDVTCKYG